MSNLSMVEATLPPGFRFHPRDEELVCDYLSKKVSLSDSPLFVEVDLNKCEPWDLPETGCVGGKEWYFFSQRDRKYATGIRTNRATVSGYWKATGKDRSIHRNRTLVGMRKTLVFYLGRAPKGNKTDWVMHEFRLQGPLAPPFDSSIKEDWVICRVFCKNKDIVGGKQISNNGVDMGSISRHDGGQEDTVSCSSSLPPLMDPYTLSFDQSQPTSNTNIYNQQVPCFSSILNPLGMINVSNPQFDLISNNHHLFSTAPPPKFGPYNQPSSSSRCCEEEVIKTILSRFNKTDNHNNLNEPTISFGEGISDQSFLSDAALPVTMWYP